MKIKNRVYYFNNPFPEHVKRGKRIAITDCIFVLIGRLFT
jgi:hypothetical protein